MFKTSVWKLKGNERKAWKNMLDILKQECSVVH